MRENQVIELEIDSLSPEARGLANYDGKRVFVTDALPGETVKAEVLEVRKNTAIAQMTEVIKASPDRVTNKDAKWAHDGFARLANLKYDKQLEFKKHRLEKLLNDEDVDGVAVSDVVPSPEQVEYRNQIVVPVREVNGQLEIGFFKLRTNEFVPLNSFLTTNPEIDKTLVGVRDILRKLNVKAYDEETNSGFIRSIDVRRSDADGSMLVTLVARQHDSIELPDIMGMIMQDIKNVTGTVLNYNPHRTTKTFGKSNIPLWGNDYIIDKVNDLKFRISPKSYFQPNTKQVTNVVNTAIKEADFKPTDKLIDAYCGVGKVSLSAANKVASVRGIEVAKVAIEDARKNVEINHIDNAKYYSGSVEQILARWAKEGKGADVITADPPEKGLTKGFIEAVDKMNPRKFVYISANPDTLVRDLKIFKAKGYHCNHITPIDVAPQTPDMKCVCVLYK